MSSLYKCSGYEIQCSQLTLIMPEFLMHFTLYYGDYHLDFYCFASNGHFF